MSEQEKHLENRRQERCERSCEKCGERRCHQSLVFHGEWIYPFRQFDPLNLRDTISHTFWFYLSQQMLTPTEIGGNGGIECCYATVSICKSSVLDERATRQVSEVEMRTKSPERMPSGTKASQSLARSRDDYREACLEMTAPRRPDCHLTKSRFARAIRAPIRCLLGKTALPP